MRAGDWLELSDLAAYTQLSLGGPLTLAARSFRSRLRFTQGTQGCAGSGTISNHRQEAEQRVRAPQKSHKSGPRRRFPTGFPQTGRFIPWHTAAHVLRWPCKPVTSIYADQAG